MNGNILDTCWFCQQAVPANCSEDFGKTEVAPGEFRRNYVHPACMAAADKALEAISGKVVPKGRIVADACLFCRHMVLENDEALVGRTLQGTRTRNVWAHSTCLEAAEKAEQANKA